jgi:hypothetical protein
VREQPDEATGRVLAADLVADDGESSPAVRADEEALDLLRQGVGIGRWLDGQATAPTLTASYALAAGGG